MRFGPILRIGLVVIVLTLPLGRSDLLPADVETKVREYTQTIEFDYITWTINALSTKISQNALGANRYLTPRAQHDLVVGYMKDIQDQADLQRQIDITYSDPQIHDPDMVTTQARRVLSGYNQSLALKAPLVESILQSQINTIVAGMGLTVGGEPVPPIWYHTTSLPLALIISPRTEIRTEADVSLLPDLPIDQIQNIENLVSENLDVSALVVPVGGIGIYPTMVMETSNLNWLLETISHEWTHNYLTLRPLGLSYENSPELRTMNETAASISGVEIGQAIIQRYYPEFVPQLSVEAASAPVNKPSTPIFDYRSEMRQTRVLVDQLLAAGRVAAAEAYMEERRVVFWEHGYYIRKLNQAYFAFYGAYADQPGGAAGADPVGPAVRALRKQSTSLADFLNRISWMTNFDQLKKAVQPKQ